MTVNQRERCPRAFVLSHWHDAYLLIGDTGWDIFSLHYKLTSPVNTVINEAAMMQYQRIFHFLWRLKRVEHALSGSWSKDMHLRSIQVRSRVGVVYAIANNSDCVMDAACQSRLPSITPLIHRCQLLRSEMIHFISKVHNYMMFEVRRRFASRVSSSGSNVGRLH